MQTARVTCSHVAAPLAQEGPCDGRLSAEDCDRHRALAGGQVVRPLGDDIVAVQALVLEGSEGRVSRSRPNSLAPQQLQLLPVHAQRSSRQHYGTIPSSHARLEFRLWVDAETLSFRVLFV